jgi:type VI secretion system secreted protein VgrG
MEQEEAHFHRRHGQSGIAGLNAGLRIRIADIDDPEVLVTEVRHRAEDYSHWSGEMWGNRQPRAPFYENSFVCIPKRVPFRAERVTPKPFVRGPQTAVVTGPAGEEIHTDKYGRVKVRFHWDRVNPADDTSSCWVRVSQGWAGAGWGQIHIPRVGHEVIVDFLEGDPDRPIITGRVYNAQNKVPYALPANKTQSGIKSNSTKGGGGSNEFRFEDKKGSEEIYLHAEKDLNSEIENNETRKVGGKGTGNRTTEIKNDETTQIGGNKKTTVNGNFDETVFGKESRMVLETVTENFGADETRTIAGNQSETIGGNVTQTVAGSLSQTVAGGIQITTPSTVTITAIGGWTLVAPGGTRTIDSFFDSTGNKNADAFQFKFSLATSSIDIVSLALSVNTSLKVDLANFKIDKTAVELLKKDVETKNVTTNMNVMNIQIKMINVYLIN